ncbi:DUF3857 domain-containing protein [Brevundimonas sp. PAMC22021]|uniref:DUF3857 domain-containing protein n=1 Tax=Brevundimonas sp. PAMC22021 TaxID=2861285 RepID=UPI001C6326AB|nr:DUF3857 domain-containing protein [Brevundimonas sp. PAMC22021]QYF86572.1 DUF3857 domain-containing protein [Brevundimonas sp. PAMC22021]
MAVSAWLFSTSAVAGEGILRGPAPDWLPEVAPHLSNKPDNPSQPLRYEVVESHVRAFGDHTDTYMHMRLKVLSPLGLQQASQLSLEWNPALQTPTVHHARIIRAGETTDILDKSDFTILRREVGLEQSQQITGVLTGVLVNPDIRVGDTIDFAYSVRTQFDVFDNPLEAIGYSRSALPIDLGVTTVSWPSSMTVQTRTGRHTKLPPITQRDDFKVLTYRVTDTDGSTYPDRIAPRSLLDHGWQISNVPQWATIADHVRPAFDQAISLPDAADLADRVQRIRSEHGTPEARALAALRLVQDEVRYMALTLGEGGWLPTSAGEVWASRQGDCKGKTVLLVALLRALDIDAVPVLVSSNNLPLDKYLPMVSVFDHVIVRTRIGEQTYLLDGARIGDRSLKPDVPLVYEYILPITERSRLEQVPLSLPSRPIGAMNVEIDLSDGIYSPARVTLTDIDRGDGAAEMRAVAAQVPAAELTRLFDERWKKLLEGSGEVSNIKSKWEYHEDTYEFVASATALMVFDWSDGPINIPLAHVTWQGTDLNTDERFRDADYAKEFPGFSSFRTTVILPEGQNDLDISVEPYEVEAGATRYFRTVQRNGNRLETDRGSITLRPYATATEIQAEQTGMDSFENLKATMQVKSGYVLTAADRQTLTASPDGHPEVALRRGYALNDQGDHAGAITQFDTAIAGFSSPHANALANRALAYLALNELEKGRADIAAAEAANPDDAILFHAKGRLAEIERDDLEAVLAFTGALRSWPEDVHALYRRAASYERMGQSARALADLERIAVLQPRDQGAQMALATQLLRMERSAAAYEQVKALAQSLGHPDAQVQIFIAMTQSLASGLKTSDPAKAEAVLTDALSVESDFPALLIDRAGVRERLGDTRGAAADRARFTELTSINLEDASQVCMSQRFLRISRGVALDMCDRAIEQKGNDAELNIRRGFLLQGMNRQGEAVAAYRSARDLDPSNQKAKYGLGKMLRETGQIAEGEALMAEALGADAKAGEQYDEPLLEVRTAD